MSISLAKPQNWFPGVNHQHPGLAGAWLLAEGAGTTTRDWSGHNRHGTLTTMEPADWVGTPGGGGLKFDTSAEYVHLGTWSISSPHVTLITRVKPEVVANDRRIFSKSEGSGTEDHELMINLRSSGHLRTRIRISGTVQVDITTGAQFVVDEWGTYGFTFDGENVRHFKNGRVIGTFAHTGVLSIGTSTRVVAIGRNGSDTSSANAWIGDIESVLLYERAFSPQEMAVATADLYAPFHIPSISRRWSNGGASVEQVISSDGLLVIDV